MHVRLPLPGEAVWIRRRRWRIERVRRDRHVVRLDVAARDCRLTFLSPFDRVIAGTGRPRACRMRPRQFLARLAGLLAAAPDARLPLAAVRAHADILPHQLEPALAFLAGHTRMLLADEVGLGKTVQAGLVIAELARRDLAQRVLVVVPASLRDQWMHELTERFRLELRPADRAGLDAIARAQAFGESPWSGAGIWIASPDFLKQRHVADGLPEDLWDLVVIDEAHGVCGDSDRYELCHSIAARSRRVLLLTATPHAGDAARFSRLLALGRLDHGTEPPLVFRRTRTATGHRLARRVRWHRVGMSEPESRVFDALVSFERAVITRAHASEDSLLLLSVFRKRALSTMRALSHSLARRLSWLGEPGIDRADWLQPRFSFDGDEASDDERPGLTAQSGLGGAQERSWLRRLRTLAEEAARDESKVDRLAGLIHRTAEPVVVFSEYRDSLDVIARRLHFSRPVSILHGGQDAAERRTQLRRFLGGATSVLLATDVAGQGLNLQSRARWVISLELPWNPVRLEQRIGRVDRIAQTRSTHFTLLLSRDDAESGVLRNLSRRVLAAQSAFGASVLADVSPPESDVRTAILLKTPTDPPAPGERIQLATRWTRAARTAARVLERRRRLAGFWRAPDSAGARYGRVDAGRIARLIPAGRNFLAVFSVPLLDRHDLIVERRVVPIAIRLDDLSERGVAGAMSQLGPLAAAAAERRSRALSTSCRQTMDRLRVREAAILNTLREQLSLEEVQPGLFDLTVARAHEVRVQDLDRITERSRSRTTSHDLPTVRVGDAVLEFVVTHARR